MTKPQCVRLVVHRFLYDNIYSYFRYSHANYDYVEIGSKSPGPAASSVLRHRHHAHNEHTVKLDEPKNARFFFLLKLFIGTICFKLLKNYNITTNAHLNSKQRWHTLRLLKPVSLEKRKMARTALGCRVENIEGTS